MPESRVCRATCYPCLYLFQTETQTLPISITLQLDMGGHTLDYTPTQRVALLLSTSPDGDSFYMRTLNCTVLDVSQWRSVTGRTGRCPIKYVMGSRAFHHTWMQFDG